ncbi:MAG: tetratricopeptide repeat protein [Thermodesulfobacteriota bacterium]|nr:tetratricopeptide repeat protein [Thermodesulfobacteriota bacterium]
MEAISAAQSDALFSATYGQIQQLDSLAEGALRTGIDLLVKRDYQGALREFKRSVALSPTSANSVDASNYMATAYLQLNEAEKAIGAYRESIRLDPMRDDVRVSLGNLYFSLGRYAEAERQYEVAVQLNPSANNHFALGQVYLSTDRLSEAQAQFNEVRRLTPDKPNGSYGLGLVYSKEGRYEEAIREFEEAIGLDKDFYDAYAEIGYARADQGQKGEAQEMLAFLVHRDLALANTLSRYIYTADRPNFTVAYSTEGFGPQPPKTPVSSLHAYLAAPDASKTFTMTIAFDKEMDRSSVENRANWQISRASGAGPGEAYNFGLPIPSTEVRIASIPDSIYYDSESWTATVKFTVRQNASANGTIDPSHIQFQFKGKDLYGLAMDTDGDQYSHFSGIA